MTNDKRSGRGADPEAGEPGSLAGSDETSLPPAANAEGSGQKSVAHPESLEAPSLGFDEVNDDISDVSLLDIPVLIIFWVLFLIVALQFFTRYVLNDSLGWTEEIARFFLIFLAFVGSITCIRRGSHIYLEFFYRYLPASAIKPLSMFVEGVVALFFGFAGWFGIGLAQRTFAQRMISIDLPKGIVYWVVVVACFAMMLAALANIVRLARRPAAEVAAAKLDPTSMAGA